MIAQTKTDDTKTDDTKAEPGAPTKHWSDCAVYNAPAYPNGPCNCGGRNETSATTKE